MTENTILKHIKTNPGINTLLEAELEQSSSASQTERFLITQRRTFITGFSSGKHPFFCFSDGGGGKQLPPNKPCKCDVIDKG